MAGCRILRDTDICFKTDKNSNHLLLMVLLTLTSSPSPTASPYKHCVYAPQQWGMEEASHLHANMTLCIVKLDWKLTSVTTAVRN